MRITFSWGITTEDANGESTVNLLLKK